MPVTILQTDDAAKLADTAMPKGHACLKCGSPVDEGDRFCNACGTAQVDQAQAKQGDVAATHTFECQTCGAALTVDVRERSITCPFCDSNYVVEIAAVDSSRQAPEFVIGFTITPEQALEKFRAWIQDGGWFRPGDLHQAKIEEKLRGVYIPFWSFSMLARSQWSATIGENWQRTESYTTSENGKTVTKTRTVTETEWWPLSGKHHRYYSGYLVSGSRGLPQQYAEMIKPFRTEALKRYEPYFLAGWLSEEYSVDREEALAHCKDEFQSWEKQNIKQFMPGDSSRGLVVTTEFSDINSDLILLPIYLLSYRYGDKVYRFLINGQTGKAAGDKPYSRVRIGALVAAAIGVLIVLVILFFMRR